eukprot:s5688_g5.t2
MVRCTPALEDDPENPGRSGIPESDPKSEQDRLEELVGLVAENVLIMGKSRAWHFFQGLCGFYCANKIWRAVHCKQAVLALVESATVTPSPPPRPCSCQTGDCFLETTCTCGTVTSKMVWVEVLEPQLPDDLESTNLFVMLTEESRRDRNRRIDMGDDSAKLKIVTAGQAQAQQIRPQWPQQQGPYQGDGYKGSGCKGRWRNW